MARKAVDRFSPFTSSDPLWCLANNDIVAVGRYYSAANSAKNLNLDEVRLIMHSDISYIISVYQDAQNKPSDFNYQKGKEAAEKALRLAKDVGQVGGCIYFAVDYDASHIKSDGSVTYNIEESSLKTNVLPFFEGAQDYMRDNYGFKLGVYGSYDVVRYIYSNVADVHYKWQTKSWSSGQRDQGAHIYQYEHEVTFSPCSSGNNNVGIVDLNELPETGLFGGWRWNV